MSAFVDHYLVFSNFSITRWLVAALAVWIACLILFVIYLCVDAPKADDAMNEQEYRHDYDEDGDRH